jgi:hypothetical protein
VANAVGRTAGSGERALSSGGSANERAAVRHVAEEAETGGFSKFGHSFTPGTKVVLASGAAVAISSLKVGDKVRSVDPKTEKSTVRMVAKVHVNHDSDLLDLTVVRNGHRAVMHTTARHPFWSQSRKAWVRADQLGTTDELKTDRLKTDKTGVVRVARVVAVPGDEARWDLTVATDHDYYVVSGQFSVLVHNNNDCGTGEAADLVVARVGFVARPGRGGLPGGRPGMSFTKAGKDEVLQRNASSQLDGVARCANPQCAVKLSGAQRSTSGVTPRSDEAAVDHVVARANGGSGDPVNGQGLCRACNRLKSDGDSPW